MTNQIPPKRTSFPPLFSLIPVILLMVSSCKKDAVIPNEPGSEAEINFYMKAGSTSFFEWDTIKFVNAAGNSYAVSALNMFISGIKLCGDNGLTYTSDKVFYIDPSQAGKSSILLENIPPGAYNQVTFYAGLDAAHNVSLSLPATMEMQIPAHNPLTVEGVNLGKKLYYDPILSNNGNSCSSCHNQSESFSSFAVNSLPHLNLGGTKLFCGTGK